MTIIEELEKLLHEHQDLTAMVSGPLLAKDLRELVGRYKADDHAEFELIVGDCLGASASGTKDQAWAEIMHYAAQYANEGPIEIYRVTRERVELP